MNTSFQKIRNKIAEVKFRQKLIKQHTGNNIVFPGEPDFKENLEEIRKRVHKSSIVFNDFKNREICLSPFLEIAAGQGYRSDLLCTRFKANGFATDISQHTLSGDKILSTKFNLNNSSIKICCDAYNLPFLSSVFPFVFIALSLHHFPDPKPIIKEAARVLQTDGYFYFDEEPIEQKFNLNLWRRDYHLRWFEKILKYTILLLFLSRIGRAEVDYGILEETFSFDTWEKALSIFDEVEVEESVFPFKKEFKRIKKSYPGWIKPNWLVNLGIDLFGGGIRGLCRIKKKITPIKHKSIMAFLACPTCRKNDELQSLFKDKNYLICRKCNIKYYQKQNIWMLLEPKLYKKLYG